MKTLRCLLQLALLPFVSGLLDGSHAQAESLSVRPSQIHHADCRGQRYRPGDADRR